MQKTTGIEKRGANSRSPVLLFVSCERALAPGALEQVHDGEYHKNNDQDVKNWSDVHDGNLPEGLTRKRHVENSNSSVQNRASSWTPLTPTR